VYCVETGAYIMQMAHGRIVIGRRVVIIARFSLSACALYYSYLYAHIVCIICYYYFIVSSRVYTRYPYNIMYIIINAYL